MTIESVVQNDDISGTGLGTIGPGMGHGFGYLLESLDEGNLVTSSYD